MFRGKNALVVLANLAKGEATERVLPTPPAVDMNGTGPASQAVAQMMVNLGPNESLRIAHRQDSNGSEIIVGREYRPPMAARIPEPPPQTANGTKDTDELLQRIEKVLDRLDAQANEDRPGNFVERTTYRGQPAVIYLNALGQEVLFIHGRDGRLEPIGIVVSRPRD